MPNQVDQLQQAQPQKSNQLSLLKAALTALVGTVAAVSLQHSIPQEEGTVPRAYRDVIGVWTICTGDTHGVKPGEVDTKEQCEIRLYKQLIDHAAPLLKCVPELKDGGRDYIRAASVSLAYNIGDPAFCRSSIAAAFRRREWRNGCDRFMLYDRAGGRVIRGLHDRRVRERAICLQGA